AVQRLQHQLDALLAVAAAEHHRHRLAGRPVEQGALDVQAARDADVADLHHHVAALDAGLGRRARRLDPLHHRPAPPAVRPAPWGVQPFGSPLGWLAPSSPWALDVWSLSGSTSRRSRQTRPCVRPLRLRMLSKSATTRSMLSTGMAKPIPWAPARMATLTPIS